MIGVDFCNLGMPRLDKREAECGGQHRGCLEIYAAGALQEKISTGNAGVCLCFFLFFDFIAPRFKYLRFCFIYLNN